MPKHRSLSLKTFVHGISWDLFQRYFERLTPDRQPSLWAFLNEGAMEQFLNDPQNAEASGAILEDFRRINDIAADSANLLVQAYHRAGADFDEGLSTQELSMRLFLDHPDAFQYAWSRYLFYSTDSKLTFYPLEAFNLDVTEQKVEQFRADLELWFSQQAKGGHCKVHWYQEDNQTTLHIERGSYLRTVARWKEDHIEIETFRPATEDLIIYDPEQLVLAIKASLLKEREFYLLAFATHIAGDPQLAQAALEGEIFSLEPLQKGNFDYSGNGHITKVELVRARLRLDDLHNPEITIKSRDVLETLQRSLRGLSLQQGQLTAVRLRFQVQPDQGRSENIAFDIEPPSRTDLAQKRYSGLVEEYLKEQGVKLR